MRAVSAAIAAAAVVSLSKTHRFHSKIVILLADITHGRVFARYGRFLPGRCGWLACGCDPPHRWRSRASFHRRPFLRTRVARAVNPFPQQCVRSSAYYTYYILCVRPHLADPFVLLVTACTLFFFSQTSFENEQKKDAWERKERVHTHTHITTAVHVHVYIVCVEKEKMAKKKLISNTMPKRTRRPLYLYNSARHNPIQRYGEYCLSVCVCVCVTFFCLKVGMQTSIGDANTAPLPGSSRPLNALCSSAPVAHVHRITIPADEAVSRRWLRVTLFAPPPTRVQSSEIVVKNYSSLFTEWTDFSILPNRCCDLYYYTYLQPTMFILHRYYNTPTCTYISLCVHLDFIRYTRSRLERVFYVLVALLLPIMRVN